MTYIIGIDEVGRGPIAGPVVVCACARRVDTDMLHLYPKQMLKDSKKLSEKARMSIVAQIKPYIQSKQIVYGLGEVDAARMDTIGLTASIQEALTQALNTVHALGVPKDTFIYLDGSLHADASHAQETVIRGDASIQEISLASIIAKVHRDAYMQEMHTIYPVYGFDTHVGYGTKAHYEAIARHGLTPLHRKSFLRKHES
jgi:ribonuclease HII